MKTRQAQREDIEAWAALRHALWPDATVDELRVEAERMLSSPDEVCYLLFDPSPRAVGFIEGAIHPGPNTPYVHVEGWYVDPKFRGKGLGRKLVDRLENWSLHRAICLLTSDTSRNIYPNSPRAHASCGFRVLSEQTIFVKELKQRSEGEAGNPQL